MRLKIPLGKAGKGEKRSDKRDITPVQNSIHHRIALH
jgi:hypothetical protein